MHTILLSPPDLSGDEISYIQNALEQNNLAPNGPNIALFEGCLSEYLEGKKIVLLQSGTASIHLALVALGIGIGDIVLCQSLTFAGSAFPIKYVGATPVFIDSELATWNMCPNALEEAIVYYIGKGKKPKAVIGVHLYGNPMEFADIYSVCQQYEIPFIEDAACALGSRYNERPTGALGDFGVISFNTNKIITTSGGGALVVNSESMGTRIHYLASQSKVSGRCYKHEEVGYNYKMSNILAGIGLSQFHSLEDRVRKRREINQFYRTLFKPYPFITFQEDSVEGKSNNWLTTIRIQHDQLKTERLRVELNKLNIESRLGWNPMHLQKVFHGTDYWGGNLSEQLFYETISLPSGSSLTSIELEYIRESILRIFSRLLP